jgi:hypothetical protein
MALPCDPLKEITGETGETREIVGSRFSRFFYDRWVASVPDSVSRRDRTQEITGEKRKENNSSCSPFSLLPFVSW